MARNKFKGVVFNNFIRGYIFDGCNCLSSPIEIKCSGIGDITFNKIGKERGWCRSTSSGFSRQSNEKFIFTGGSVNIVTILQENLFSTDLFIKYKNSLSFDFVIEQLHPCADGSVISYVILKNCVVSDYSTSDLRSQNSGDVAPIAESVTVSFDQCIVNKVPQFNTLIKEGNPVTKLIDTNKTNFDCCSPCDIIDPVIYKDMCGYIISNYFTDTILHNIYAPPRVAFLVNTQLIKVDYSDSTFIDVDSIGNLYTYDANFHITDYVHYGEQYIITDSNRVYLFNANSNVLINLDIFTDTEYIQALYIDEDILYVNTTNYQYRYNVSSKTLLTQISIDALSNTCKVTSGYFIDLCSYIMYNSDATCSRKLPNNIIDIKFFDEFQGIYYDDRGRLYWTNTSGYNWQKLDDKMPYKEQFMDWSMNYKGEVKIGGYYYSPSVETQITEDTNGWLMVSQ